MYHFLFWPSITHISQVGKWRDAGLDTSKLTGLSNGVFRADIKCPNLDSKELKRRPETDCEEHDNKPLKKPRHEARTSTGTPNPPEHGATTASEGAWTYGPSHTSENAVYRYSQMITKNPSLFIISLRLYNLATAAFSFLSLFTFDCH